MVIATSACGTRLPRPGGTSYSSVATRISMVKQHKNDTYNTSTGRIQDTERFA